MFKRILVLSAAAGNGHIKAADGWVAGAREPYGPDVEIRHVECLEFCTPLVRKLYSKGYIHMVNHWPEALGWMYDALDKPWHNERRRLAFHKANAQLLIDLILDYQPDVVVSTHFLGSELVSWLKCSGRLDTVNAIVVTDFDAHAMWLCRHYDHYFVALEETKVHLAALGIDPEHITVSGIPIDPVFAQQKDKRAMRERYGLDQDLPTILLSAGGYGVGPMEQILDELCKLERPVQVLALCGRNEELKKKLEARAATAPASLKLFPIGYTDKMDEYMSAADILLGKPGGLTTSEALAKHLVFVIVNPIPGQEERNSDHLLESGVAVRCNNLPALAYKLNKLLADPEKLRSMQAAAAGMAHPRASAESASLLAQRYAASSGVFYGVGHKCRTHGRHRKAKTASNQRASQRQPGILSSLRRKGRKNCA
jgi:processive 1,2-diacylglycerol beta-glucosyltransferase